MYTDFGGGRDWANGEAPMQAAFREFAEELLGLEKAEEARDVAAKLCTAAVSDLVGGRPFVHKGYVMFIVRAEVVFEALQLRAIVDGGSAIDQLFAMAQSNSELTSVALVSIAELLRGACSDGEVCPCSVRQLDGRNRNSHQISLRRLLVGKSGSICKVMDILQKIGYEEPTESISVCKVMDRDQSVEDKQPVNVHSVDNTSLNDQLCCESESSTTTRRWGKQRKKQGNTQRKHLGEVAAAGTGVQHVAETSPPQHTAASSSKQFETAAQVIDSKSEQKLAPYIFDMETGDPDDVLTLLFLGSHPAVELRAVTITPGSDGQVALVRWLLQHMGLAHVRLGAQQWPSNSKKPVDLNAKFYKSFGRSHHGEPTCERADKVLLECCDESVTLLTGAPLHNLGDALKLDGFHLGRWVAQGGFAGEGVVPREMQMDKFKGKDVCSTWNFGGNIPAAEAALASSAISRKICVSKNVCHSVMYDDKFHQELRVATEMAARHAPKGRRAKAFATMYRTMDEYLRHHPGGKKLHDPLALAVAIDESVCDMEEVQLFCRKGQWGSYLWTGSNIWISIAYNASTFHSALLY